MSFMASLLRLATEEFPNGDGHALAGAPADEVGLASFAARRSSLPTGALLFRDDVC
jgi:hypothetical protein